MYASYLRQTYFDMPIHVYGVLVFSTKHIFGFNIKNMDIYMFHVYWIYIHMQHALKVV